MSKMKMGQSKFIYIQFVTFFLVLVFSFFQENLSLNLTYLLFLIITFVVDYFQRDSTIKFYFNCYVLGSLAMIVLFQLEHGTNWYSLDDLLFYEVAIGKQNENVHLFNIRWWGYLLLLKGFYLGISEWIDSSSNFYHGILLSSFLSSFIPHFYRKHFYGKLTRQSLNRLIIVLLFLPQFVVYNSTYLRDSIIMLLFAMLVYFVNLKTISNLKKLSIIIFLLILGYSIRPGSSIFLISYLIVQLLMSRGNLYVIYLIVIILIISYFNDVNFRSLDQLNHSYSALTDREASSNSIGNRLLNNESVLFFPLKFLYILFSPIPPPIITKFSLKTFVFSIGLLIQYYFLIIFLISGVKNFFSVKKNIEISKDLIFTSIIVVAILFSSRDPRHLNFLFPLVFMRGITYLESNKFVRNKVFGYIILIIPLMIVGYYVIKYNYV